MTGRAAVLLGPRPAPVRARGSGTATRGPLLALTATALAVALAFSVLRSEIVELRYRAADVLAEERALAESRRVLEAEVSALRDPRRLAEIARERGFARPQRLISLGAAGEESGR